MCYQCYGCGKCAGINPDSSITLCVFCHTEVEEGTRWCPNCGNYIRPKTGSIATARKKRKQQQGQSYEDNTAVAARVGDQKLPQPPTVSI